MYQETYDREFVIAKALYDELQKIAYTLSPEELAGAVKANLSARKAGRMSMGEMASLNGRSAVGGMVENVKSWLGGRRVKKDALRELAERRKALNPSAAKNIGEQNERLKEIANIRGAEREIAGARGTDEGKRSFFSSGSSPKKSSSLSNVAFGAGLGAAGLLGGQKYLASRQQEPQY